MEILAQTEDGRHILMETDKGRGFIRDRKSGNQTEEKAIEALLSANMDWIDYDSEATFIEKSDTDLFEIGSEQPDPASLDFYEWIDNSLEKAGVIIGGDQPKGAISVGKGIEMHLYGDLQDRVGDYLNTLQGTETEVEVLNEIERIVDEWTKVNADAADLAFEKLFKRGFAAGLTSAGGKMGSNDRQAMQTIREGRYRIGDRIVTFGQEAVAEFSEIIKNSYGPKGEFDLDILTGKMDDAVPAQRYKLERIARTETSQISNLGRLMGWETDPDKYFYRYYWRHVNDGRTKDISKLRASYNPLTFDEADFLWHHQEQMIDGKWHNDVFNQRCTLSRSPSDTEFKGNRFQDNMHQFRRTLEV